MAMNGKSERTLVGDRVTIVKRGKKGVYQADYHYAGEHRRRSLKTSNKKIAIERATKLAAQIYDGTLDAAPENHASSAVTQTTLTAAIEAYLVTKKASGLRPKTLAKYGGTLTAFGEFATMKKATRVDQVTLELFDAYRTSRSEQKVRGKAIGKTQMYHDSSLLSRFLYWCVDRNMIAVNPLASQKLSRPTPKRKEVVLTLEHLNAILAALPKRIVAPVAVLAFGGMRSANCRNLMVHDIDLEGGWIYIRSRDGSETKCGNS
jgi:integrase